MLSQDSASMAADCVTRETILSHMRQPGFQPCRMKDLARSIGVPQRAYRDFRRLVRELENEGLIVRLRRNRFGLPRESAQIVGQLRVHPRGFGFVVSKGLESDLFIPRGCLGVAIDGDQVRAEVTGEDAEGRGPEGRVTGVVRPSDRTLVGTVVWRGGRAAVEADDPAVRRDVFLPDGPPSGVEEGARVVVRITERGWGHDGTKGEIDEVLGQADEPAADFLSVVRRYDLPVDFSAAATASADKGTEAASTGMSKRLDLRGQPCVTIDPQDARDFDDAVSLERIDGTGYRLGVHIADVSHFVQPGTALDCEAFERGCSVYLLDHVIHMLPEKLASERCSLRPAEDRLAVSVLIDVDQHGAVKSFQIAESVIRSAARLDYQQVQAALEQGTGAASAGPWAPLLHLMRELSRKRQGLREKRGALDLDIPEPRVDLDQAGVPYELGQHLRLESHRLVEEFMLLANECVGQYVARRRLPVPYRVHPPPDPEKLRQLADIVPELSVPRDAEITTPQIQQWLRTIGDRDDAPLLNKLLLQSMMRASYSARDTGHFGLACRRYLHFTSPIRRYPDLLVHRVLKASVRGQLDARYREDMAARLSWIARWCSQCEQRAEEAERTYRTIKQLRYMEQRLGEEFPGVVSAVLRGGFFVEVGDFATEGFCFLRDLQDYFEYDPRRQRLVGRRTGQMIQVGAPVRVRIAAVDWNAQEMDLDLVEGRFESQSGFSRARQSKRGRRKRPRRKRR